MSQNLLAKSLRYGSIRPVLDEFRVSPQRRLVFCEPVRKLIELNYITEVPRTRRKDHFGTVEVFESAEFALSRKGQECLAGDYKAIDGDLVGVEKLKLLKKIYTKAQEFKRVEGVTTDLVQLLELGLIREVGKPRRVNEKVTVCAYAITIKGVRQVEKQLSVREITALG